MKPAYMGNLDGDPRALFAHDPIPTDMFDMLCGEFIGKGISRAVYDCETYKNSVIKVEYGDYFQNIYEFHVWKHVQGTDIEKWFAPCYKISPNGKILIQARTTELKEYPDKVPAFFTDIKADNWGAHKGHPVCHDYGIHLMLEKGMTKQMRKAHWS